jgi:hypothetical protein
MSSAEFLSRRQVLAAACGAGLAQIAPAATQTVIRVGPNQAVKSISRAASMAQDGDVIEVDAGEYHGDVAVWTKNRLTVRAVGGRAQLFADGMAANGKGIWVVQGSGMTVEGFEFSGATVKDANGAGIRLEKGALTVRDCLFTKNQNGILTNNDPEIELAIYNSEFGYNGHGDGQSHNIYVGQIARLMVTGSYFHHAKVGHLLKSRAAVNEILYNRLTDEIGGTASYELEFPSGGVAKVIGNIIQQGSQTGNPHLIAFGAEGYKGTKNELYLINNTLVDDRPNGGVFLRVKPDNVVIKAVNNLLVGRGKLDSAGPGEYKNNPNVGWEEFAQASREDYRLTAKSKLLGTAVDAGVLDGQPLMPRNEYRHPRQVAALRGRAEHPGALQSVA